MYDVAVRVFVFAKPEDGDLRRVLMIGDVTVCVFTECRRFRSRGGFLFKKQGSPTLLAVAGQTSLWLWGERGQERREYVSASTEQHPMNAAARV